uniref:Uncharacterized protein n=1 Tax=Molossus molossus TaxID=27622 RepID=A0A7J8JVL4_MOLMO|nr:hypothetical protein HJG59_007923 [Molossus molossus]
METTCSLSPPVLGLDQGPPNRLRDCRNRSHSPTESRLRTLSPATTLLPTTKPTEGLHQPDGARDHDAKPLSTSHQILRPGSCRHGPPPLTPPLSSSKQPERHLRPFVIITESGMSDGLGNWHQAKCSTIVSLLSLVSHPEWPASRL